MSFVRSRLRGLVRELEILPRTVRLVRSAAPGWTAAWLALLLLQGLLPLPLVLLGRTLVDRLLPAIQGDESVAPAAWAAAALAVILLLLEISRAALEWVRRGQAERVRDHVTGRVHAQCAALDIACFDSAGYHDQLHRAATQGGTRALAVLESGGGLLQSSVTLVALAGALMPYAWWLPLALLASALPALAVLLGHSRRFHRWWEGSTQDRRWAEYYHWILTSRHSAAEVRLFELGAPFGEAYQAIRARLRGEELDLVRRQAVGRLGAGLGGLAVTGGVLVWAGLGAVGGALTVGDIALFQQAFTRGQGGMRTLMSDLNQLYKNLLHLRNLFEFLALEPLLPVPAAPATVPERFREGLVIDDITFRYPGTQTAALEGLSVTIPAQSMVAIVGANGAGKSSLIKLLLRFYDPDAGSIHVDGVDLREVDPVAWRRRATVLFQAPVAYQATAAENIALGDRRQDLDDERVRRAAELAGAHEVITRLPRGYDTLLGKLFEGGADLSLGEYQRLALARANYREAELIILDEPTSFMDSWAETRWLEAFRRLARGRTSVIVTHRFTTAMLADRIYVVDRGRVVESGSHDDLVAAGGAYAESWHAQMQGAAGREA